MAEPDEYSAAWYAKQFRGLTHITNRQAAESVDQFAAIQALRQSVDELQMQRAADVAKIGELQTRLEELERWRERLGQWLMAKLCSKPPEETTQ